MRLALHARMTQERGQFDATMKAMVLDDPVAWASWVEGTKPQKVTLFNPDLSAVNVQEANHLLIFDSTEGRRTVLHLEFQTDGDTTIGVRMFLYVALIVKVLSKTEHAGCPIDPVVIYLHEKTYKEDPGSFVVPIAAGPPIIFCYRVIKAWELDPQPILDSGQPSLLPIVPLTKVADPEAAVVECVRRLHAAGIGRERRRELTVSLGMLSGLVIRDKDRLSRLFREADMTESAFIEMWVDKGREEGLARGRQEGRQEGRAEGAMDLILEILTARFGAVPQEVRDAVRSIAGFERLRDLARAAARTTSIEEFRSQVLDSRE